MLNRFGSGLHFDQNPFLQIRNERRCLRDEKTGKFILDLLFPTQMKVIRRLDTKAKGTFPPRCMGRIDFRRGKEVERCFVRNPILIESLIFSLELIVEEDLVI
jgi:hypothetical protein